ncbi:hypothetical protein OBBRIDRAFT_808384 [Obba rivulosa]|uniref:CxC2-like cysteine cluster KDZ transposase-associated domain-containing protein n=1 Tax=Obba rivulosa TaxID=1052685 RepID=A0A8E2DFX1_9APHY|nr:hypothetical protein OBBRIDRAFT_808384 [Obba rivulosa]
MLHQLQAALERLRRNDAGQSQLETGPVSKSALKAVVSKGNSALSFQEQPVAACSYRIKELTPSNLINLSADEPVHESVHEEVGKDKDTTPHIQFENWPMNQDPALPRRRTIGDDPLALWVKEIDGWLAEMIRLEGRGNLHKDLCLRCYLNSARHVSLIFMLDCHSIVFSALPHTKQLLRARIFPATTIEPKTGATFRILEHFHIESAQAGTSVQAFYNTLARCTDNAGITPPKNRYPTFLRMIREWRYLKALKRGGRGHERGGAQATTSGKLAVLCPAHQEEKTYLPGLLGPTNLPMDWADAPANKRWLYKLFVGIDGNFRLKRKKIFSDVADPGLYNGQVYFVEEKEYKNHIKTFGKQIKEETNTCHNHDAATLANVKGYEGLAASGVVAVQCTRHKMKRPCSVGDLQRGEHYINVDYAFLASICGVILLLVVVSYNIACQWLQNFWSWVQSYGSDVQYDKETAFLIPKFHLPAHQSSCQDNYSFNLTKGVGRTDGEAPERGWALSNVFGPATKEMGPGSRRDLLDDVFASILLRKAKQAANGRYIHAHEFKEFDAAIPASKSKEWEAALNNRERDPTQTNPFTVKTPALTIAAVQLKLAEEEAKEIEHGRSLTWHIGMSPSMMLMAGLELQELQWRFHHDAQAAGPHTSDLQHSKLLERRNTLQRKTNGWFEAQKTYIPGVDSLRSHMTSSAPSTIPTELLPLLLPSQLYGRLQCPTFLVEYEWRLREAQAYEALDNLRLHLRLRSYIFKFKDRFVIGIRPNTHARSTIDNIQQKINADAAIYRFARTALKTLTTALGRPASWQASLQKLKDEDVRGISDGEIYESEGHRTMSWIWKVTGVSGSNDDEDSDLHEALQIEWCKSRARFDHWSEECELVEEEMRRVVEFHDWQHKQWLARANTVLPDMPSDYVKGLKAYAYRQADIRASMCALRLKSWQDVPRYMCLGMDDEPTLLEAILEEDVSRFKDQDSGGDPEQADELSSIDNSGLSN